MEFVAEICLGEERFLAKPVSKKCGNGSKQLS